MGYFGQWLVAKGADARSLRRLGLEPKGEGAAAGWHFADADGANRLAELVAKASEGGGAAVGAAVYDSDFAYVVAARNGVQDAELVVDEESARSYDVDVVSDPEGFASWTDVAPQRLTADEVRAVLRKEWVFAEEGVQELLERAGLPEPYDPGKRLQPSVRVTVESVGVAGLGEYERPLRWMREEQLIADERVPWRDSRYVPGAGADFLGIWDREQPSEPALRFPQSPRGEARLVDELNRLQEPLLLEKLDLVSLGGFRRPFDLLPRVSLVQRELSVRDARYVAGHGDGFVGVWDRERPAEPIERFDEDEEARARGLVYRLLFEHQLAQKKLPGLRLVHPRQKERLLEREWRGRPAYAALPGGPWLVLEEEPDDSWRPAVPWGSGRFYLYVFPREHVVESLVCHGAFASVEDAHEAARSFGADGEWIDVPAGVPRDLLSTVRWVEAELEGEAWYDRFEPVEGDPELVGARSFVRLYDPESRMPDAILVFARGDENHEAATYLVRAGDEPRLVYTLGDADALLSLLPNYLHERTFGEWREVARGAAPRLHATAAWASLIGSLT